MDLVLAGFLFERLVNEIADFFLALQESLIGSNGCPAFASAEPFHEIKRVAPDNSSGSRGHDNHPGAQR